MSQRGWFRDAEVKAAAKCGVKAFPVYLLGLLLLGTGTGALTVGHKRGRAAK